MTKLFDAFMAWLAGCLSKHLMERGEMAVLDGRYVRRCDFDVMCVQAVAEASVGRRLAQEVMNAQARVVLQRPEYQRAIAEIKSADLERMTSEEFSDWWRDCEPAHTVYPLVHTADDARLGEPQLVQRATSTILSKWVAATRARAAKSTPEGGEGHAGKAEEGK